MKSLESFLPIDRLHALAAHTSLPDRVYGTAMFADISGFTPLTEKLVKAHGRRIGSEELNRRLNLIYEALITQVHNYGGTVLNFSGDAITCWFDTDNGWRAVTCALEMQAAIARLSSAPLVDGLRQAISIKVGLAAGPARRFCVGAPDIQVIDTLAGSTLARMTAAEKLAGKGEVVIGPEIEAQLGDNAQVIERMADASTEPFYVLTGLREYAPSAPWPGQVARTLTDEELRPWVLQPIYERFQSGSEQFLAESRIATALFLKFNELDYDSDDEAIPTLDTFIVRVQRVLDQHGGHVLQLTFGDKKNYLYATFGAPVTHDDDAQRAIAAALRLSSLAFSDIHFSDLHIGLSQGRVFAGIYGSSTRRTFGVLGNDVNLAARLMDVAQSGQILVSQHVFETTVGSYRFRSLDRIQLKGIANPLPVYQVIGEGTAVMANSQTDVLIGRDHEIKRIDQLLAAVESRQGRILRISGAGGVGKSRLKAELIARASDRRLLVVQGVCHSSTRQVIYWPWRQILSAMFDRASEGLASLEPPLEKIKRVIADINADWLVRLPLLSGLLDLPIPDNPSTGVLTAQQRQTLLNDFVVDLWRSWCKQQPAVIILEDAHWLDEASQQLTVALARALTDLPIGLVVVHRPSTEEGEPILPELDRSELHHSIDLDGLSVEASKTLIIHRLSSNVPLLAIDLIQRGAQGNPLFVEQLIDDLCDTGRLFKEESGSWILSDALFTALLSAGCLEKHDDEWRLTATANLAAAGVDLPDSLQALTRSRLDRLPLTLQLTLKVASVIGEEFDVELLARAHPEQADRARLHEQLQILEVREMLHAPTSSTSSSYSFQHAVAQEAAYATLSEEQRRGLHGAVGQAIEQAHGDRTELLAYHFDRSADNAKAMLYLDKAARVAQLQGVSQTALSYFTRALSRADKWQWRAGKIEAWHVLGERAKEFVELQALDAMSDIPPAEPAQLWGDYYEATGYYLQAQIHVKQALAVCHQNSNVLGEVRCLNQLGAIAARQGEFDHAREWHNQALDILANKGDRSAKEALIVIRTLNGLGVVECQQGLYTEGKFHFERALELSRMQGNRLDEAQALNNLGMLAAYQRDFGGAQRAHSEALQIRREIGHRVGEGSSLYNLGSAQAEAGNYSEAETNLRLALKIALSLDNHWDQVKVLNGLGGLYLLLGDLTQAESCLTRGLTEAHRIGEKTGQAYALGNLGQAQRDAGDLVAAEKSLSDSLSMAHAQGDQRTEALWLSHLSTIKLQAGLIDQAIDRAQRALDLRNEIELTVWTTADLRTLASAQLRKGNIETALSHAQHCIAILDAQGGHDAEFPHRDYYVCFQVFLAAGQDERACAALQSAYQLVMDMRNRITNAAHRESYLAIPINREIISEYHKHNSVLEDQR